MYEKCDQYTTNITRVLNYKECDKMYNIYMCV